MRIVNRTRGSLLGARVRLADTAWTRFRGYLGRREPARGEGILLAPCSSIHTMGMGFTLDVLFLDDEGRVLAMAERLRPWRIHRGAPGVQYVLEVPEGTISATGTQVGDELTWTQHARTGKPGPRERTRQTEVQSSIQEREAS